MIGQLLADRYQVVQPTGSGAFGESYLALDTYRPGYPRCVVKKLRPLSDGPKTPQMIKLLLKTKIKILAKLGKSDYVPAILDFFESEQDLFVVEEFIPGYPLSQEILPNRPWSEDRTVGLLQGILEILVFVHGQGVIHQDLQPANIIRRQPDGRFMLTNFRLVREVSTPGVESQRRFKQYPVLDAPAYKAVEQFENHPLPSSDIYALGMIAIQTLTGFSDAELSGLQRTNGSDAKAVIWHHQAHVHPQLAEILDRMVRRDFRHRYQSATEVLHDLQQITTSQKNGTPPAKSVTVAPDSQNAIAVRQPPQPKPLPPSPAGSFSVTSQPPIQLTVTELGAKELNHQNGTAPQLPVAELPVASPSASIRTKLPKLPLLLLGSLILVVLAGLIFAVMRQLPQQALAQYALKEGETKRDNKDYEGAIAAFNRAIELNGNNSEAYYDRGLTYFQQDNQEKAVEDFTRAIQLNAQEKQAYFLRGSSRLKLGDRQGALEDFNQTVQLDPNFAPVYQSRGNAFADLGDERAAVNDYSRAIQIDPSFAPAFLNRCLSRSNLGDQIGAIDDCTKAINLRPNYAFAYQNRGLAYRRKGDLQKALEDLNVAIRLNSNDADPYYNRGLARFDLGDRKGAIDDYNTAVRLNPTHTLVYYDRAVARAADGDRSGALEDFQQAAKLCLDQGRTACYKDAQFQIQALQKQGEGKK